MRYNNLPETTGSVVEESIIDEVFSDVGSLESDRPLTGAALKGFFDRIRRVFLATVLATRVDLASVLFVLCALFNGFLLRYQVVDNAVYPKAFLSDIGVFAFFSAIGFVFKRRWRPQYYIAMSVFFMLILIFDVTYFRTHNSLLSMFLLPQIQFLPQVSGAVVSSLRLFDLFYVANTAIFVGFVVFLRRRGYFGPGLESGRTRRRKLTTFLVLALLIFGSFATFLTKVEASRLTKQWNRPYLVEHFGIFTFHMSDLAKYVGSFHGISDIEPERYRQVVSFFEERNRDKGQRNAYTGILEGQSVISIHGESIESMFMFRELSGQEITPNLNRLASQGLFFDNFYAQQSSGTSSDSEFTLNTSLYPINNGTVFISHFKNSFATIPKKLKEKGYTAVAMHGNHGDFWNREIMNQNLGYDRFYSKNDFVIDEVIGMGLSDISFFRQAAEILDNADESFYATLIMLTNHTPFEEIDKYGEFDAGEFEGTRFGNYLKSLHYADRAIGSLMSDLERRGMLDDTAVVIYGDHPANLSKAYTATFLGFEDIDVFDQKRFETVPFLVWSRRIGEPRVVHEPMGMIDVMPTLGNMLGFDNPFALGKDIFSSRDNAVAFPDGSWIDSDILFIASTMKFKVFGDDLVKRYKNARCEKSAQDQLLGATGPAAEAIRCRKISRKRVYKFNQKKSIANNVQSLGAFVHDRVQRKTTELARDLDISSLILEYDLLRPRSEGHPFSIAQLD